MKPLRIRIELNSRMFLGIYCLGSDKVGPVDAGKNRPLSKFKIHHLPGVTEETPRET